MADKQANKKTHNFCQAIFERSRYSINGQWTSKTNAVVCGMRTAGIYRQSTWSRSDSHKRILRFTRSENFEILGANKYNKLEMSIFKSHFFLFLHVNKMEGKVKSNDSNNAAAKEKELMLAKTPPF